MNGRRRSARRSALGSVALAALALVAIVTSAVAGVRPTRDAGPDAARAPIAGAPLVFAYYYIWFDPGSWDRAKTDYPSLGRYDSADPAIIAQHVAWAKAAGIDGLIVSWKDEPRLNAPLLALIDAARAEGLRLVLLYQGLDFNRNPLPASRIAADLVDFVNTYGKDEVFNVFGKPAVILSGTPSFSRDDLGLIRRAVEGAGPALLLGSERDGPSYAARSDLLDGDAYYWSSVDPTRDRNYRARLDTLAAAIRADKGLWLAPAAPGFDARMIGGTRIIDRGGGTTYRAEWDVARATNPDAIAIISWNEFSENSYIEPSITYGTEYLALTAQLVRDTLGRPAASDPGGALPLGAGPVKTSAPVISDAGPHVVVDRVAGAVAGLVVLIPIVFLALRLRRRRTAGRPA